MEISFWTQIPICDFVIIETLIFNLGMWKEKWMVWGAGAYLSWCIQITIANTLDGDTVRFISP